MDKLVEEFLSWAFSQHWRFAVPLVAWVALFLVSPCGRGLSGNETDRKRWIGRLSQAIPKRRYIRSMTRLLDGLDARLSGWEIADGKGPAARAWSVTLLTWVSLLAVVYPLLSITGQWLAGAELTLMDSTVLPAGSKPARIFVSFWLGGSLFLYALAGRSKPGWRWPLFMLATLVLLVGLFFSDRFEVPNAVAVAVTVAFTVALAVTVAFAFAFTVTVAFAGAVAFAFAITVAGAVAGAVAFEGAFAFAFAFAGAVAFAFAILEARWRTPFPRLISLLILLTALTGITTFAWSAYDAGQAAYFVLFVGLFPLYNSLADFASVGLTRYLLRKGLAGLTWWEALLDLIGGAAIFALLGCALIAHIHFFQTPDGPLLDLRALFQTLDSDPGQLWWLAFMLGSTLVPTLLHAAVAVFTLLWTYPKAVRARVIGWLDDGKHSGESAWLGGAALSAMLVLSLWVPVLILHLFLTAGHAWLLEQVIAGFRGWAGIIGAI